MLENEIGPWRVVRLLSLCAVSIVCVACVGGLHVEEPEAETSGFRDGWFDCRVDADCQMIRDPLCRILSVNRAHVADIVQWVATEQPPRRGGPSCDGDAAFRNIEYSPRCDTGKCSSMPNAEPFLMEGAPRRAR